VTAEQPTGELPGRDPNPLLVHIAIDTAIAFLVLVIVLLILGVSIWVILGASVVVGVCAAPFTRQAEVRALAERRRDA
jgi:hypothetical protein